MTAVPLVAAAAMASSTAATSQVTTLAASAIATAALASHSVRLSEITLTCGEGLKLAAQSYQPTTTNSSTSEQEHNNQKKNERRILCLHGWMDNCRTFHHLAPVMSSQLGAHVVTLDLPGHGRSGHKSVDSPPTVLAEAAYYVHEAVRELSWKEFCLVGHSMGAAVSCLYAAAFPEHVSQLVLLEGAGPLARNPADISKHVRMHVERRQLAATPSQKNRSPRIYESLQQAVQARMATARTFPGKQYLSEHAALELVRRGTRPAQSSLNGERFDVNMEEYDGPVQFIHDPRLQWPSAQYFTEEQNEGLYKNIQCPVAFLGAEHGWPFEGAKLQHVRELLQPSLFVRLPGSHHFHADPDTAPAVADNVVQWLQAQME